VLSRFGRKGKGLREYQKYMHEPLEREIEEYYGREDRKPTLGSKESLVPWLLSGP
jgi:hypothetical protein